MTDEQQEILEEKRHDELVESVGKVAKVIAQEKESITKALAQNTKEIGIFASKLSELKPEVNVDIDQKSVIEAIHKMAIDIKKTLENQNQLLENLVKPKEGTFTLIKNSAGWTEAIEYKQKK